MSPITTHVLDTARGCPAAGLPITLEVRSEDGQWLPLAKRTTNEDGRVAGLLDRGAMLPAVYRMVFDTQTYFDACEVEGFYPYAAIVFRIVDPDQHYHVPLLLSPFGYSTYRGS